MFRFIKLGFQSISGLFFKSKQSLVLENLALRHQLASYKAQQIRPQITDADRLFWVWLSRVWDQWKNALIIVKPDTVVSWHKRAYRKFWKLKARPKSGRKTIDRDLIKLIREMASDNGWGAPRIHGELLKLGLKVSERTVSAYIVGYRRPPTQSWKTFISNHMYETVAIDFFQIPTLFFKSFLVFVAVEHNRRKILHFNVSRNPNVDWVKQQLREIFPGGHKYKFLILDNDSAFKGDLLPFAKTLGITGVHTKKRSPWQNGFCERLVGTIKRELFTHIIPLNERHLRLVMKSYIKYYNKDRTHIGLKKDSPLRRKVERTQDIKKIKRRSVVGGLYKRYYSDLAS